MTPDVDEEAESFDIFQEPPDYYPPPAQPRIEKYTLPSGRELSLRLVGHNALWGHYLWNAGRAMATYLDSHPSLVESKSILELGAGAGLPSLVSAILGASTIVVTDYPDPDLIENLRYNIDHCQSDAATDDPKSVKARIVAEGFLWGADPAPLLAHLDHHAPKLFDTIILADLLFNHSEHAKLVSSIQQTLSRSESAQALAFFTAYRPWLLQKDLAFFDLAQDAGLVVEKVLEERMEKVMFEEDRETRKYGGLCLVTC